MSKLTENQVADLRALQIEFGNTRRAMETILNRGVKPEHRLEYGEYTLLSDAFNRMVLQVADGFVFSANHLAILAGAPEPLTVDDFSGIHLDIEIAS